MRWRTRAETGCLVEKLKEVNGPQSLESGDRVLGYGRGGLYPVPAEEQAGLARSLVQQDRFILKLLGTPPRRYLSAEIAMRKHRIEIPPTRGRRSARVSDPAVLGSAIGSRTKKNAPLPPLPCSCRHKGQCAMTLAMLYGRCCRCAKVCQSAPNFGAFREFFAVAKRPSTAAAAKSAGDHGGASPRILPCAFRGRCTSQCASHPSRWS